MYRLLCEAMLTKPIYSVERYFQEKPDANFVILRHDVDRRPTNALTMAKLEHELGIKSTYYFRYKRNTFRPDIIKEISDMGHDIGYHYETLSKCDGDYEQAIKLFEKELDHFRSIVPISSIAMHGKPLSSHINKDLWSEYNLNDYALLGEAFDIGVSYYSDSGRSWGNKYNLRDYVEGNDALGVESTSDLISIINNENGSFYISNHPERWNDEVFIWYLDYLKDVIFNFGKLLIGGA